MDALVDQLMAVGGYRLSPENRARLETLLSFIPGAQAGTLDELVASPAQSMMPAYLMKSSMPEWVGDMVQLSMACHAASRDGHPWFDRAAAVDLLARLGQANSAEDSDKVCLRNLRQMLHSPMRRMPVLPDVRGVVNLKSTFPNLGEAVDFIAEHVAMRIAGARRGIRLPSLLLVGSSGIGKTLFASTVAGMLGSELRTLNMASLTGGFVLSGNDRKWGQSGPGLVTKWFLEGKTPPVILLDEIDKASRGFHDATAPLYHLLDDRQSAHFVDEFFDFEFDFSMTSWMATANSVADIPQPILDRFHVIYVPDPTLEQIRHIASRMYGRIVEGMSGMPQAIPETWLDSIGTDMSLRELERILRRTIGKAALERVLAADSSVLEAALPDGGSKCHPLQPDLVPAAEYAIGPLSTAPNRRRRIGF